jgi:hypothetical protein
VDKLQLAKIGLKRGSICHWQQPFGPHFAIILNLDWPPADDVVLFSIMTSKTSKFPSSVDSEIIRTGNHDYSFLTLPTVIDLRQVHVAKLSAIVMQPQFAVRASLTAAHLTRTDQILRASLTIEQNILDRIVK